VSPNVERKVQDTFGLENRTGKETETL